MPITQFHANLYKCINGNMRYTLTLLLPSFENFLQHSALWDCWQLQARFRRYNIRRTDYYYEYFTVFIPKKQTIDPVTQNTVLLQIQKRTFLMNRNAVVQYPSERKEIDVELLCNGQGKIHFKSMNSSFEYHFALNKIYGTLIIFR